MPRRSTPNEHAVAVGARMRSLRDAQRLTQDEAAAKLLCSPGHLGGIERGLVVMKIDFALRVSQMYSISLDALCALPTTTTDPE